MKILDTESNQFITNSSLLRGEQVFSSLLFYEGKLLFFDQHLARLIKGATFLFPQHNWPAFAREIKDHVLAQVHNLNKNYYCRLTIIDDTFFIVKKEHAASDIEVKTVKAFQVKTPSLRPSYLKLSQYADSLLELRRANSADATDILYFDHHNFLTEASTSNLFVVKSSGEIVTPYVSSMVLDGILRTQLCTTIPVVEENITEENLVTAKEIWLTNSIKGMRFVSAYEGAVKTRNNSLFNNTLEKIGRYGEKNCE